MAKTIKRFKNMEKNYYGWASKEQYKAVFEAIKGLAYDYETIMVSRRKGKIKIFLDDVEITLDIYEESFQVYCDREMGTDEIENISDIFLKRHKIFDYVKNYDEEMKNREK